MMDITKPQGSNFYRNYKLASRDRTLFLKNLLFIAGVSIIFLLAVLFSLSGFSKIENFLVASRPFLLLVFFWIVDFSFLVVLCLSLPFKNSLLGLLAISLISFSPFLIRRVTENYLFLFYFWLAFFGFFLLALLRMRREAADLSNLKWLRIVKSGNWFLFLAFLAIFCSFFYFSSWQSNEKGKIFERLGEKFLDNAINQIKTLNSDLDFSGTVNDYLNHSIDKQFNSADNINLDESFGGISGSGTIKNTLEDQKKALAEQTKKNLSEVFKIPITGEEKFSTLIIAFIKNYWQSAITNPIFKTILYFFIFFLAIGLLSVFNLIFSWVISIFSWIILQILISSKLIKIETRSVEKKFLSI